ncbi:hypothetical protein LBMAG57_35880 [Verrucomicrobiota bacterium]|nr:hypothetical protein LBMAG57_35880 [Verrucomicrobiota bacterium]
MNSIIENSIGGLISALVCTGILRIEVAEPAKTYTGHSWRDLLAVRPDYIEGEIDLMRRRSNPFGEVAGSLAVLRGEQHVVADWLILGECKFDRRAKRTPLMIRGSSNLPCEYAKA